MDNVISIQMAVKGTNTMKHQGKTYAKVVKAYHDKRIQVAMMELPSGYYRIQYQNADNEVVQSETINDYALASMMYDSKIAELLGN